jgi:hypothetical protein
MIHLLYVCIRLDTTFTVTKDLLYVSSAAEIETWAADYGLFERFLSGHTRVKGLSKEI